MPLIKSSSKQAVGENIDRELDAGKPRKQAIAIALSTQRRAGGGKPVKKKRYPGLRTAAAVVLAFSVFALGCASTISTVENTVYPEIGTVSVVVDTSMNAWGDYARGGHATDPQQATVRGAYEKFQNAMAVAEGLVASAKPSDTAFAGNLKAAQTAVSNAGSSLVVAVGVKGEKARAIGTADLAILILQALIQYGPGAVTSIQALFAGKAAPTSADWAKVFAPAHKSYDFYVAPKAAAVPGRVLALAA
jgi:hypothetical protein